MEFRDNKSVDICRIALKMSISSREEEKRLRNAYKESDAFPSPQWEISLAERGDLLPRQYFSQPDKYTSFP